MKSDKVVKIDLVLQRRKLLDELLNKDASVYFNRGEKVTCPINKNIEFLDKNIFIKERDIFQNDMFWLKKGIESTKAKDVEWAIDYYKQALNLNPNNFDAAFNLACEYEKQDSLTIAKQWFLYCTQLNDRSAYSHWGVAVWAYK